MSALHADWRSKRRALCLVILAFLSLQCIKQPLAPVAPTWDVQISAPLIDTLRSVSEMLEKDTSVIQRDPVTNLIVFSETKQALSDSIGDRMRLGPRTSRLHVRIGALSVSDVLFSDSVVSPIQGTFPVFPPQTIRVGAVVSPAIPDFSDMTFGSGIAELTVTNNLPVAVSFPETLKISDGIGRTVAAFFFVSSIPPAANVTATDSLTNRSTDNTIRFSSTPAFDSITVALSGGSNVTFDATSELGFSIAFRNLSVTSATARIPTQAVFSRDSAAFEIDDSTFVQSATFKEGSFNIRLSNHVDLTVRTRLRLPQLLAPGGAAFDSAVTIDPFVSVFVAIDLTQYRFQALNSVPTRFLVYTAQLYQVDSTGSQQATFTWDDTLAAVVVAPDTFVLRSASAAIQPLPIGINQPFPLSLGDLPSRFTVDSLVLPDANFTLNLTTPVEARVADMHVVARKGAIIDTIRYRVPAPITLLPGVVNPVVFNDANSTIVQVLNRFVTSARTLPDSLRIFGDGLLNPNYDTTVARSVADTSKISGDVRVDFPLNVGIRNGTVRDTIDIADKVNIQQEDLGRLNRGTLTFNVFNSLPAALQVKAVMLDASGDSMWVFPRSGGISINAANVGSDGFSNQSVRSIVPIALDRSDVQALVDAKFLRFEVTLNTSSSQPSVKFRTTDSMRSRVYGTLSIRIGPGR